MLIQHSHPALHFAFTEHPAPVLKTGSRLPPPGPRAEKCRNSRSRLPDLREPALFQKVPLGYGFSRVISEEKRLSPEDEATEEISEDTGWASAELPVSITLISTRTELPLTSGT